MKVKKVDVKRLVISAMFLALGIVLPFVTMQIPRFGNMLLPMHIPVILCGFLCGAPYGFVVGLIVPLLRSALFGAPMMIPTAISMAFELATYGLVSGWMYRKFYDKKCGIYISLITAMILGRISWGIVTAILFQILGFVFTLKLFFMQAVVNAIPGIVIQLILIPFLVYQLKHLELVRDVYERE